MKKLILCASALMMAVAVNADKLLDLSKYQIVGSEGNQTTTVKYQGDSLLISYSMTASQSDWASSGVEFALDNVTGLTKIDFFKTGGDTGEGESEKWVSLQVYVRDSEGIQWYDQDADLAIGTWKMATEAVSVVPANEMWTKEAKHACGDKPFVAVGFIANAGDVINSTFAIKTVILRGVPSGLDEVAAQSTAKKVIKDGKLMIQMQDGRVINALGAEY